MELITDNIIKNILSKSGESEKLDSILSCESEAAVGHGENYCSNILRVRLKLRLTSGKIFSKTLILKVFLQNLSQDSKDEMKKFFSNELNLYEKILIKLGDLAEKHNFNHPRLWPKCYFANTDLLVFDDLNEQGFVVAPRQNGLKLEDGLQVMKYIGQLHALSIVAEKRKMIDPSIIRSVYAWVQLDSVIARYVRKGINMVGNIMIEWGKEWKESGRKVKAISKNISSVLNKLYTENVKMKVVNHGDAWINNIMVRYNKDNIIERVKFIDFQNAAYNSYGWDLVFYLYTSLQGELMRSNYESLLTAYREQFLKTLRKLNDDEKQAPTMDEIKAEIVRLHPFCLSLACTVQAAVFNISKEPIELDELSTNDQKLRTLFTSDVWKSSLKAHIKYFQQQNVI